MSALAMIGALILVLGCLKLAHFIYKIEREKQELIRSISAMEREKKELSKP